MSTAPPDAVPAAFVSALRRAAPDVGCRLFLVDYPLRFLRPLDGAEPALSVDDSAAGRCFAAQQPVRSDERIWLPVSLRADRLGVIELTNGDELLALAGGGQAGIESALGVLTELLAQALLAADRVSDTYRMVRRGERSLTLAAEMQWDAVPGTVLNIGYAAIAAHLEPAYSVVGDTYDWAADGGGLTAAMVDGAGFGSMTATSTSLVVSALRNARREGADLAGAARLADQALYAREAGRCSASAVLLDLTPGAGPGGEPDGGPDGGAWLRLVVAGEATVLVLSPRGTPRTVALPAQPPLGAEEDHPYTARTLELAAGDRLVVVSDGMSRAKIGDQVFGAGMERALLTYRLLGAAELVRAVVRDLRIFHGAEPLQDDAVVLCLDVLPSLGGNAGR